jgi:hypothetical protein
MQGEYIEVAHSQYSLWFSSGLQKYGQHFSMGKLIETIRKYKIICMFSLLTSGLSGRCNFLTWSSECTWRLFESQPQIIWAEREKPHSSLSAMLWPIVHSTYLLANRSQIKCTQVTSVFWERSMLLCTHYIELIKKFTFVHWSSFSKTENLKPEYFNSYLLCRASALRGLFRSSTSFI